jgi:hypothetical protein
VTRGAAKFFIAICRLENPVPPKFDEVSYGRGRTGICAAMQYFFAAQHNE